jgi:thiosulfate/3-mercaptopyruvate sulfurtransferase
MTAYANPTALIETAELAGRLDDPGLAVVEVDEDTTAYAKGHIPGAVTFDWQRELHAEPRRDFITADRLAELLGSRGIAGDQTIVLYGGNNNWFAAYAYWLFRLRGVDRVRLLNGGRMKWELESRPLDAERPGRPEARFPAGPGRPGLRILRDEILARVGRGGGMTVDVRSPAEFAGELLAPAHLPQEQPQVPGHIPGARNIPWSKAANEDGSFKAHDELLALYEGAGILPGGEVVTYCRIGERSAHTWFVLTELLGYPEVRNYDGSWTEYGSLVDVPVEREVRPAAPA